MRAPRSRCPSLLVLLLAAVTNVPVANAVQARARANPIRKVVTLLQNMEKKVRAEGDKKKQLFDKFACFCKNTGGGLETSIAGAEERIPQLESGVKQARAAREQISSDLSKTQTDMAEATKAIEEADALRQKDAQAFEKASEELKANIKALGQAVDAISKGLSSMFLQTNYASLLRRLSLSMNMNSEDRDLLSGFLAGGGSGREPRSDEVLGMLKQMKIDMAKDLDQASEEETQARGNHDSLVAAKQKEIRAAQKAVEDKTQRVGKLAVDITTMQNGLEDAKEGLEEDKAFLSNLQSSCKEKQAGWDEYTKLQSQELVAIADTIKLLNDDDALDLFKKTLPTAGLVQTSSPFDFLQLRTPSARHKAARASRVLRKVKRRGKDPRISLIEMALLGKKGGMDKIMEMVDRLVSLLDEEQKEDERHRVHCEQEIDKTEDESKVYQRSIADKNTVIADTKDSLETVRQDIDNLILSIKKLDVQVQEATAQRKAESANALEAERDAGFAKEVLELAKQKLVKFYHNQEEGDGDAAPAASFVELDSEDAEEEASDVDSGDSQMPEGPDLSYKKSHESAGGAMQMIEMLRDDLTKQIAEFKTDEKHAQEQYEEFLQECKAKRALDAKAISDKEGVKAELEEQLQDSLVTTKNIQNKLKSTLDELMGLHKDCDWLLQNFEVRRQARAEERDSLNKAKAVLSSSR